MDDLIKKGDELLSQMLPKTIAAEIRAGKNQSDLTSVRLGNYIGHFKNILLFDLPLAQKWEKKDFLRSVFIKLADVSMVSFGGKCFFRVISVYQPD